jgi:hypothetical protein
MNTIFFDGEERTNPLNGSIIQDRGRLLQILNGLRNRQSFICELRGENGFLLHIGIGELGHAQYSRSDGKPPYLMAVAPLPASEGEDTEFLLGGTPTPISNRYCMPFEFVREIAAYFLETGGAHPGFSWEEI